MTLIIGKLNVTNLFFKCQFDRPFPKVHKIPFAYNMLEIRIPDNEQFIF